MNGTSVGAHRTVRHEERAAFAPCRDAIGSTLELHKRKCAVQSHSGIPPGTAWPALATGSSACKSTNFDSFSVDALNPQRQTISIAIDFDRIFFALCIITYSLALLRAMTSRADKFWDDESIEQVPRIHLLFEEC